MAMGQEKIAVVGLGYVGLPLAALLRRKFADVIGFDISLKRIGELREGIDTTREFTKADLDELQLELSSDPECLKDRTFIIVTVPTPVDANKMPDLRPVRSATVTVGRNMSKGACVVYESTVYPGVTEDICRPLLAKESGLTPGVDFTLGYSPERVNPGDKNHTIEKITKVVSAEDEPTLKRLADVYGPVITAGIHLAPSIKIAEAAKVIENTQRDLNIALMNELATIFELMGLRTADVLAAAGTKWNFLNFQPGLVGGHCIGVDPYYLTAKAQEYGYHPRVILAGREINDGMGAFIAQKLVKMVSGSNRPLAEVKIGVLGITFKENVPDLRNSKVPDIVTELAAFGIKAMVHDPFANPHDCKEEYGIDLCQADELEDLDGLIYAVAHRDFLETSQAEFMAKIKPGGALIDVKSCIQPSSVPDGLKFWSL